MSINEEINALADRYGYDSQSRQCIEEMAELTQAINKFWRNNLKCGQETIKEETLSDANFYNLVEEIADVEIMLQQMIHLLDCEYEVKRYMRRKVDRQQERIKQMSL